VEATITFNDKIQFALGLFPIDYSQINLGIGGAIILRVYIFRGMNLLMTGAPASIR
jgi:hypothetical protein